MYLSIYYDNLFSNIFENDGLKKYYFKLYYLAKIAMVSISTQTVYGYFNTYFLMIHYYLFDLGSLCYYFY